MAATFATIRQDILEGKIAPLYFFEGEESFYIDELSALLEEKTLPPEQRDFNSTIVYGKDVEMGDVVNAARRFPMMAERQLVMVKEAQEIKDFGRKEGQDRLAQYLDNLTPSTVLVFCHKNKTLHKGKTVSKRLQKEAVFLSTKKLYDNQVPAWVQDFVAGMGHSITPKAANMVAGNVGNDLVRIAREIQKLLLNYSEEKVAIDDEKVQKHIGISKDFNSFELQGAIASGQKARAFQIIRYFAANPKANPAIPLVSMLFTFFSRLVVLAKSPGLDDKSLASQMGVSPYFLKEYKQAARFYSLEKSLANIAYLRQADLQLKGISAGNMPEGEVLKELVFKLMNR